MDNKNSTIVNVCITPANVNDVDLIPISWTILKRDWHLPRYMGVDDGYRNAPTCHQIARWGIQPVSGYCRHTHKGERFGKYRLLYNTESNIYICPQRQELTWRTTNREGYREY